MALRAVSALPVLWLILICFGFARERHDHGTDNQDEDVLNCAEGL
jgi:hypothetical protein